MKAGVILVWVLFIILLSVNVVYAIDDLGYVKGDTNYNLLLGCTYNGTYCVNTVNCNLTLSSPTKLLLNNVPMTTTSFPQYNYTISATNLTENGQYYGSQVCCGTAAIGCSDYSFKFNVNPQGKDASNDGVTYMTMFLFLISTFVFSIWAFIRLPFTNGSDSYGDVVHVEWKKYLKICSAVLAYVCFIGITYFAWNISYGVLQFEEMGNFFKALFTLSYFGLIVFFPITMVFGIAWLFRDYKLHEKIQKGLTVS